MTAACSDAVETRPISGPALTMARGLSGDGVSPRDDVNAIALSSNGVSVAAMLTELQRRGRPVLATIHYARIVDRHVEAAEGLNCCRHCRHWR